jgi:hypothetical protein
MAEQILTTILYIITQRIHRAPYIVVTRNSTVICKIKPLNAERLIKTSRSEPFKNLNPQ